MAAVYGFGESKHAFLFSDLLLYGFFHKCLVFTIRTPKMATNSYFYSSRATLEARYVSNVTKEEYNYESSVRSMNIDDRRPTD